MSMEIGETLHLNDRKQWRKWLEKNHRSKKEIWLIFYKKDSGIPFIPYDDAVEEALCFGWIDSIIKKYDHEGRAQRFTPRNPASNLSELNKERIRRMIKSGKMNQAGIDSIQKHLVYKENGSFNLKTFTVAEDIINRLKQDPEVWKNYQRLPDYYKNIRIGFIETARKRPEIFEKRLNYFMKMTAIDKKFGSIT